MAIQMLADFANVNSPSASWWGVVEVKFSAD